MLQENNKILEQFKSQVCTKVEVQSIILPYFERISKLRHLGLIQEELNTEECKTEDLPNYFKENVDLIDKFYKLCFDDQDYWSNLPFFYLLGETKSTDSNLFDKKETSYTQTIDDLSYSIQLLEDLVQIQFMDLLNGDKLILEYQSGNQYLLAGTSLTISLEPPSSKLIAPTVFGIPYPNNDSKDYIFNLVVMDPA
eukprot:snap_masked-scaffold_28-processed-gene-3.23-mRNA-1 protein AED:1.00 eAED:1.00 QI:0/0/0/0/1/1/2/0/195